VIYVIGFTATWGHFKHAHDSPAKNEKSIAHPEISIAMRKYTTAITRSADF
jgi:hypothetical protein